MFPRGSTLSFHSPFWKSSHIWRYKDILSRKSSHKATSISVIFWTFLLGKLINSVDPQGNSSREIIVEIYAGTSTTNKSLQDFVQLLDNFEIK